MECITIPEYSSLVRVFHAVPLAAAVDVYVNDHLVFPELYFRQFTNYIPLSAGEYFIDVYVSGTMETPLLQANLNIPEGGIFTTIATGTIEDLQLLVLDDSNLAAHSPDTSFTRIVHLATNTEPLNIQLNDMPIVQGISYREMTAFFPLASDSYLLTTTNATNGTTLGTNRITLADQTNSTIYILGDENQISPLQSVDGSTYLCNM